MNSVGILGGGLSGLTLGYFLKKQLMDFVVLEKEEECGGLTKTLMESGFTFDYGGSHIIFSKNKEVLDFMIGILGNNKRRNKRNTKVLYKGRYIKYPFENGLSDLPKEENFECLYYYIRNLLEKSEQLEKPNNLQSWCYSTFGKGIAEKYLIPYNEKIWKYPSIRTGLTWVKRIPNPPIEAIIKSSLGLLTEGYTHQLHFYYPLTGGIRTLTKKLEEEISNSVVTKFEVKEIRKEDQYWVIKNGNRERFCKKIISTIPIQNLISAMDAPKEIKKAAKNLKYNSLITVMLGLKQSRITDLSWLYIPEKTVLPHRVSFPSNYSPKVIPQGKSSLLAEITCKSGDKMWNLKDEAIIENVEENLCDLKIINKGNICFAKVKRIEYAYVIDDLEHEANMDLIREYVKKVDVGLVGRFSEFEYLNMDDCILNAISYVKERKFLGEYLKAKLERKEDSENSFSN